uniref:Uncharacterized protein LOC111104926 n=1 Tax=Crassostrea virginica TaxID=6565 RepID=A0A8B8ATY6_CRAVI|nr:uncharacterized protein LOC111104926 [Crassostrea virginica]
MHALVEWTDEEKVSTISLTRVKEPRKNFEEYFVGEEVKATCHGFPGIHSAKILAIKESTTEGKKELEKMAEEYITGKNQTQNVDKPVAKRGRKSSVERQDKQKKTKSSNKENKTEQEKKKEESVKKGMRI